MNIFWRFFIPYLAVLIVPFVIGFFMYERTARMVEEDALQRNLALLEQSKSTLDGRLAEVESIARQMTYDPKINAVQHMTEPFKGANTFQWVELNAGLNDYSGFNKFILGYYILFANSDMAISKNLLYRLPEFYEDVFSYDIVSFEQFKSWTLGPSYQQTYLPVQSVHRNGKSYRALTYLQSVGYQRNSSGTVMIVIDNELIENMLQGIDTSKGGWVYILDEAGNVVTSTVRQAKLPFRLPNDGQSGFIMPSGETGNMLVTYTRSGRNHWTYVAGQPESVVLQKVNYLKKFSLFVAFAILLLGGLAALGFAYRNSAPVGRLIASLMKQGETAVGVKEPYQFLQMAFDGMKINNDALQERIARQSPFLRAAFFDKLFKGGFAGDKELLGLQQHIGLRLAGQQFAAGVLRIARQGEQEEDIHQHLDVQRVVAIEILQQELGEAGVVHQLDEDKMALLLCVKAGMPGSGEIAARLEQASGRLQQQMQWRATIAVGKYYASLMDIPKSFDEANKALQYGSHQQTEAVVDYERLPKENRVYDYPVEAEGRLIRFIQAGEAEQAEKLLEHLHRENFAERQLQPAMRMQFVLDVWASMTKVTELPALQSGDWSQRLEAVQRTVREERSPDRLFETVKAVFLEAARRVADMKSSRHAEAGKELLQYVDEHFTDPNLSLEVVSDRFRLSMKYLSRFFKEQTGTTFSEYLYENRMKKARDMLQRTDTSIQDISLLTGYYSANTFCRAFKRHHGISPTQFRDSR
ncbi:MAG: helix-turn-helix domain-containing protein [Paenibacillaceae bacterium]|nr:helix-turn-helix domain-containing protein [Paenibacillaceae bacterium]